MPTLEDAGLKVAEVVPLLRVRPLGDRLFDYAVPSEWAELISVGSVVRVPFGARRTRGVVVGVGERPMEAVAGLREIEGVEPRSISSELLDLAEIVRSRYLASLESCLRLVVPPTSKGVGSRSVRSRLQWVFPRPQVNPGADQDHDAAREGSLETSLTTKQRRLLDQIPVQGMSARLACEQAGVGRSVLTALVRKGLAKLGEAPTSLDGAGRTDAIEGRTGPELSAEQVMALERLMTDYHEPRVVRRQIWGVTGSGKTEVYLQLAERVLAEGAGVIMLVPEIALTPLMIHRVKKRFGDLVGIMHSGLTASQRREQYERIADGTARVVVGARSAVFAPVSRLRLVIVDESHDTSYKQEEEPRYDARTVAELRLKGADGLLVEGSASPAVEAMIRPQECIRLTERVTGELPSCEVVDMRRQGGSGVLAPVIREQLARTCREGEQAIVLLNRRGYSGHVHCETCGHVMMCEACELSLTYHSGTRRLMCHHCGRWYPQPGVCPACGKAPLTRGAPGTERLEQELRKLVPKENLFRLDSDVLTSGTRVKQILERFSVASPGVLLGTQMVAKGHDFPHVTLVVVADADTGLYVPDFRAAERTYQLLTQVGGRAGRSGRAGRVLVQTWNPDVPCIRMALDRDEEGFYRRELGIRERLGYPPYSELVRVIVAAEQSDKGRRGAEYLRERLSPHFGSDELRGPARLPALRGMSRWHLLIAAAEGERARSIVGQAVSQLRGPYRSRGIRLSTDVDPLAFT